MSVESIDPFEASKPKTEIIKIDDENVECEVIDLEKEYGEALKTAERYRKTAIVNARQAAEREVVFTSQDGMKNYADPGDWIIQNPGEDPYVFGDKNDPIEVRQEKFAKKYEEISDKPGEFRPQGIIRALQVDKNIAFDTSWGERMATKDGGWVADGGYCIAEKSFADTYEKLESEER
jgi:hypothetical protein